MLRKGFHTSTLLNEDFLEKLTKRQGSLKISESIKLVNEELDLDNIINQFQDDRIEMVKPTVNQPLPRGRYYYLIPTPASILFEETFINFTLSYDTKSIHK